MTRRLALVGVALLAVVALASVAVGGAAQEFVNPVEDTEEVLSAGSNPGGSADTNGLTDSFEEAFGGGDR